MVITYNGDGQVSRVEDKAAGHTTEYEYDGAGRLIRAYRADADGAPLLQAENLYDAYGRAKSSTYVMPNQTQNYTLTYRNKSSLLSTISLPDPTGTAKISYSYDAFDRISYMFLNSMNVPDIQTTFQYVDRVNGSATYTSSRIAKETLTTENASSLTYAYTYDANGNITEIKRNNSSYLLYEYDSLGQLTRESSYTTLTYDRYAYDGSGNRVSKNTYYWSGTLKSGETYGYTNSTWGDLLTNYDGTTISYDASGNPTKWKNASNLYWTGNRLTLVSLEGANAEEAFFSYNSEGIRTKKRFAGGAGSLPYYTDVYTVDGSRILSEKRMVNNIVRNTIYYVYDANGAVIGMEYNGTKYWYDKNLQGDVVGIRNASGTLVAQYVYDAWGNHRQITDGSGNDVSDNPAHIANINPFRYRGYYYDTETGWYYLNTRYYDPNVGRFLSPDTILGANGGLLGYNLYAYCNNNPVMFSDPSGNSIVVSTIFAIDTPVTVPVPLTQPNITSLPVPPAIIDPLIYPLPRINVFDKQGISDKTIENAKDKTKNTTDDPEEKYYYHVTTPQAAASILAESKLRPGSESYVYAWDRPPARREIELSGARSFFTTIEFQTHMAFERDFGNAAAPYGAVRAVRPGIVNIYNARIVPQ